MISIIIYKIKIKIFCFSKLKQPKFLIMKSHTELFLLNIVSYNYLLN